MKHSDFLLGKDYPRYKYETESSSHVLALPLATTKNDDNVIDKRFGIIGHTHNVVVKHAMKLLAGLRHNEEYCLLRAKYAELKEALSDEEFEAQSKPVAERMNAIRMEIGLTESGFHKYVKKQSKMFSGHISSQQMQKEASRVWSGVCDVLFGNGKKLHFKPCRNITTISGKSSKNGVQFFSRYHNYLNGRTEVRYPEGQIHWNGLIIKVRINYNDPYIKEALQHNVRYCEIKRMMFPSGWRYYVQVYLQGTPPKKIKPGDAALCEIDPGISSMAVYSENRVILRELAPRSKSYQKKIMHLQNRIDRCRRSANPKNYNADGTLKRGRHKWKLSKTAQRNQRLITALNRKETAYRRHSHNRLANDIIKISPDIRLEPMNYKALQKRSKGKTEKTDRTVVVKAKDGTAKTVYKTKRKKRFGSSCRTRAPALFVTILENKAFAYGGSVSYIDTRAVKPSQYDHVSKTFIKTDLNVRTKLIGGYRVQRDLYSAFLGYCVEADGKTFNHKKADALFEKFIVVQNIETARMKSQGISMPQCFGF